MDISIDPLKHYPQTPNDYLLELAGVIPKWVEDIPETSNVKDGLTRLYGFGNLFKMTGYTIHNDGKLSYPEDPDLYPLIKFDRKFETIYQYEYGIVAITYKDGSSTFVTRMD